MSPIFTIFIQTHSILFFPFFIGFFHCLNCRVMVSRRVGITHIDSWAMAHVNSRPMTHINSWHVTVVPHTTVVLTVLWHTTTMVVATVLWCGAAVVVGCSGISVYLLQPLCELSVLLHVLVVVGVAPWRLVPLGGSVEHGEMIFWLWKSL